MSSSEMKPKPAIQYCLCSLIHRGNWDSDKSIIQDLVKHYLTCGHPAWIEKKVETASVYVVYAKAWNDRYECYRPATLQITNQGRQFNLLTHASPANAAFFNKLEDAKYCICEWSPHFKSYDFEAREHTIWYDIYGERHFSKVPEIQ